jgi:uncharacterized protein YjdB
MMAQKNAGHARWGKLFRTALSTLFALTLVVGLLPTQAFAAAGERIQTFATVGNPLVRTEAQIRDFFNSHKFDVSASVAHTATPSTTSPFVAGSISGGATETEALNALNFVRYVAGIDANVQIDSSYAEQAQAASLVNAVNDDLTHYPTQPSGMDDELYEKGRTGAGSSNIGMGYVNPARSIVYGYMEDGDPGNIDRIGHRRWCLDSRMQYTGFGQVGRYSALYAFDGSGSASYTNVAWPAKNMPVELFDPYYPWSVSVDRTAASNAANVSVKLTRNNDGKVWNFSSANTYDPNNDLYFNVETSGFGDSAAIVFRPDNLTSYNSGDRFTVQISGITAGTISYNVNFFELFPMNYSLKVSESYGDLSNMSLSGGTYEAYVQAVTSTTYAYPGATAMKSRPSLSGVVWKSSDSAVCTVTPDPSWVGYATVTPKGPGKATITASMNGMTSGSYSVKVVAPITKASVSGINASYQYSGSAITPKPIVKYAGKTLKENVDYKLTYSKNTAVGTATITIIGMDVYFDTTSTTFKIVKATTSEKPGTVTTPPGNSGGGVTTPEPSVSAPIKVKSVKTQSTLTLVKGKTAALPAAVQPAKAANKKVTFKSSNTKVATVNKTTGKIKALKPGKATITVTSTDGKKTAKCVVTVVKKTAKIKTLKAFKPVGLLVGKTAQVKPKITPTKATGIIYKYSSSKKSVATIDKAGVITALKKGTTTITVKAGNKTQKFKVTVGTVLPTKIALNKKSVLIKAKATTKLTVKWSPTKASPKTVTWTSSNKRVATVDKNGKVKAIKKGRCTITATTWNGKAAKCTVIVR